MFKVGDIVTYTKSGEVVEIVGRHSDELEKDFYYTILLNEGIERQTNEGNLSRTRSRSRSSSSLAMTNFQKLQNEFDLNKDKPWHEWLVFDQTFAKPGAQGLVGLFKLKDNPNGPKYIFKVSQHIDNLTEHEGGVMTGLNELSEYCPHFCRIFGTISCDVDPVHKKSGNPFNVKCKRPIKKDVMLCEHIDDSVKFSTYIRSTRASEQIMYSIMKQVLMAITIAQERKDFAHYDLHSSNVMMKKCSKDIVFLYVLDDQNQFAVPTRGQYPVIIDMGFSYIENLDDGPLWPSMSHTDVGFMSDRCDWVADPKLFLVTVAGEINEERKSVNSKKLWRIVKNIFGRLPIDFKSGWDDLDDRSASNHVNRILSEYNNVSSLFEKFEHFTIDFLQSLIIMPIEQQSYEKIGLSYQAFLKEWVKIENEITNEFYSMYILRGLMKAARFVQAAYHDKETRDAAIEDFRQMVLKQIDSVVSFCRPKKINYELLLCSLYVLSRCIEGVLYDVIEARMADKEKEYDKLLPLKSIPQIYGAIEANMPDKYKYSDKTQVCIFDCDTRKTNMLSLTKEQAKFVNRVHHLGRGSALYGIYKKVYKI